MYKNKKGWYKLVHTNKYKPAIDNHMKSFNEATQSLEYKSGLELKSFRFFDASPSVNIWSLEPFPIKYVSPKDGKIHRYYIDVFVEFTNGAKFLVEVKSSSETKPPRKPKKITEKSERNYRKAVQTWSINSAKWNAAKEFAEAHDMKFIFLTEEQLG